MLLQVLLSIGFRRNLLLKASDLPSFLYYFNPLSRLERRFLRVALLELQWVVVDIDNLSRDFAGDILEIFFDLTRFFQVINLDGDGNLQICLCTILIQKTA